MGLANTGPDAVKDFAKDAVQELTNDDEDGDQRGGKVIE